MCKTRSMKARTCLSEHHELGGVEGDQQVLEVSRGDVILDFVGGKQAQRVDEPLRMREVPECALQGRLRLEIGRR